MDVSVSKGTKVSAAVCFGLLIYIFGTLLVFDATFWSHASHPGVDWFSLEDRMPRWQAWLAFLLTRSTWYFLAIALIVPAAVILKDLRAPAAVSPRINRISVALCVALHPLLILLSDCALDRLFAHSSTWGVAGFWFCAPFIGAYSWIKYRMCGS